jgi:hypothetical protein
MDWAVVDGSVLDWIRTFTKRPGLTPEITPLSFYERAALARLEDGDTIAYFVAAGDGVLEQRRWILLDRTSDPIHEANAEGGLKVTEENVLDYLRFFCAFLELDGGPVMIADDDILRCQDGKIIITEAPVFNGVSDGNYLCTAHVLHNGFAFAADFAVVPENGQVKMLRDCELERLTVH